MIEPGQMKMENKYETMKKQQDKTSCKEDDIDKVNQREDLKNKNH